MTTVLVMPKPMDPMLQALEAAPLDDEPSSKSEDRWAHDAIAEYRRGAAVKSDQIKGELGIGQAR